MADFCWSPNSRHNANQVVCQALSTPLQKSAMSAKSMRVLSEKMFPKFEILQDSQAVIIRQLFKLKASALGCRPTKEQFNQIRLTISREFLEIQINRGDHTRLVKVQNKHSKKP